jgi:hypothetical protein
MWHIAYLQALADAENNAQSTVNGSLGLASNELFPEN